MKTGTLAPLLNVREFTENEKVVLLHFFTNIDKNVYCATNNMSNQLWAFLVGQYSRSSLSMRDRFLKLFEDSKVALEKGIINQEDYISIDDLAESIKENKAQKLDFFEQKASDFLKKWGVDYGHNSLKDADRIRFAIEGVSQVFTKVIEAPFPALGDFQEKSTRYISFSKDNLLYPEMVKKSKYADQIQEIGNELMDTYVKYKDIIPGILEKNGVIKREDFSSDRAFKNTLNAKCFDIIRYLLPASVSTSLGASFSTRTLESHLSSMLSHSNDEVRMVAESMHQEALKLSPGLLSRVAVNKYEKETREKLEQYTADFVKLTNAKDNQDGYFVGIEDKDRISVVFEGDLDAHITASLLFESARKDGLSYDECLEIVEGMESHDVSEIMRLALGSRGKFDRMPRALQHSSFMVEMLVDFGAYRDIQRHRASKQLWQGATAIHGFDIPELFHLKGMEGFRKDYETIMEKATLLSKEVVKEDAYVNEYTGALGHLIRTTFEMDPGQLAYVTELRTTPQGHDSYRRIFIQIYKEFKKLSPEFAKYIRVGSLDGTSSRKKQEERAEEKRKKLGL